MSEHETYRHEDIEALLMSKAFGELLAEEKAFVMQHVQSATSHLSTIHWLFLMAVVFKSLAAHSVKERLNRLFAVARI